MKINKKLAAVAIAGTVALSGCTTINPYTGEQQTSSVAKGSAIGAIGGAVLGAATSSNKGKGALIGALGGAAVGGGIGYYMDVQEAKLRQQLQGTGVSVTRNGNNITLNMPNAITFAVNSSDLKPGADEVLSSVVLVVKEYEKTRINVLGYTDNTGSASYNKLLSDKRANAVGGYFLSHGVKYARLNQQGMGEANPIASNKTSAGRAENRRVEIVLTPM
ncbi:OmpA family protein [Vibrio marisflavi]|uniref:Lipoprotein YiaD n=1 Tax=Vibrio marisflavi CECT 7928 TaxID=634439 RepID=A0ABN8E8W2_9VIBR|nr:OmpA family protein [Vibrio marisflavi]CAH0541735.1 putative lipoprotein YiaD [Vibrio marisflavi CECT 7928]